ncbi:patatin-like phospholipase family protein [Luteimonas sp. A534]
MIAPGVVHAAKATEAPCASPDGSRPSIGLALGGGGARGIAHIGILRKLEELQVPVDCIAGTSIGALVGGLYASGHTVDELEALVAGMDWKRLFDDTLERREQSFRRKQDDRLGLATVGLGLRRGNLQVAPGLLQGQRILALFEKETLAVSAIDDFDLLPIPYRATATDLNTGEAVVLGSGSLAMAMRASMSLPGIFRPVEIDDRILLDGGLASQVPVEVVRAMGADIVIAVDVGTPLTVHGTDASALAVVSQLTTMLTTRNAAESITALGTGDVLIVPGLGTEVATADFDKADAALRIGAEAARDAHGRLATLGIDEARYASHLVQRQARRPGGVVVEFVTIDNTTPYADDVLVRDADDWIGKPLRPGTIEDELLRAYSLGTLASITYEVAEDDGRTGIIVRAREKTHGPNYLQVGLRTGVDFSGNHESNLRAALLFSPVSPHGAEARLITDIGTEPGIKLEYFHPFDARGRYQAYAAIGYSSPNVHLYGDSGNKLATYNVRTWGGELLLAREFGNHAALSAGIRRSHGRAEVEIGSPLLREFDSDTGAWFAIATVDRLDSLFFPRSGYYASLRYDSAVESLGSDLPYEQAGFDFIVAHAANRHAFQFGGEYHSTISGLAPLHERYRLGGRGRLSGFHYNELTGQHYAIVSAGYSFQLAELFSRSAIVGMTLEFGNAWERRSMMAWDNGILNGSIYIGFDSWLGPLVFGYGLREGGEGAAFLELGKPF